MEISCYFLIHMLMDQYLKRILCGENDMKSPISDVLRAKGGRMLTTSPDCTVAQAVRLMNEAGFGSVTVLEGGRLAVTPAH